MIQRPEGFRGTLSPRRATVQIATCLAVLFSLGALWHRATAQTDSITDQVTSDGGDPARPFPEPPAGALLALHRNLKKVFDPAGILNPGLPGFLEG